MTTSDPRETRAPDEREATLMKALRDTVEGAKGGSVHYAASLAAIDGPGLQTRSDLAALPVLRKSDLIALQEQQPPFGGVATNDAAAMTRLFLSPGPIAEPQTGDTPDAWRFSRALRAVGIGSGDIVHNCFSYHVTPAGFMMDGAARVLGAAVFPGGIGNTSTQAEAMRHFGATAYAGTPDYLKAILEAADEEQMPITTVKKALVSGGPLFPALREWYVARGIRVQQAYGTADVGLIAYETEAMEGLIVDEDVIVEILRPGTGDPVAEGEVGEVVVTTFDPVYPMIRFATGDLSKVMPGHCPTGRTNMRLAGWMGRADQTTKVKGMFVHPEQVARVAKAHDLGKVRLEVTETEGRDSMILLCEGQGDAAAVAETLNRECRLRGEVRFTGEEPLPNDGKVIDDKRAL